MCLLSNRHLHEVQTGRTSSISHEMLGFDADGRPVDYARCATPDEICEASAKIITFIDLAGHHKYIRYVAVYIRYVVVYIRYVVVYIRYVVVYIRYVVFIRYVVVYIRYVVVYIRYIVVYIRYIVVYIRHADVYV